MKIYKIFYAVTAFLILSVNSCFAYDELRVEKAVYHQKSILETGFRILNANGCESRMTFYYSVNSKPRLLISDRNKRITVSKGALLYIENEDELAALLSTAIAHLIDAQGGFFRRFSMSFSPRKYEIKADKKAVDLMVNAGYNPVALINLINKTDNEPSLFEYNIFCHNGSERTAYIYHYIYEKYPIFLAKNYYLEKDIYQNFLHTSKKERKKARLLQEEKLKLLHEKKIKEENLNKL